MGIFKKFVDVVKANVNDLVDKAEDPEKVIKLMIVEMEEAAVKATSALAEAMANEKNLERKALKAQEEEQAWQNKAAQALKAGREDLAKQALTKKLGLHNQYLQYDQMRAASNKTTEQLKENLQNIKSKLDEAKMRESTLIARSQAAKAQKQFAKQMGSISSGAFGKFDKMEEKIMKMEAQAEATGELTGATIGEDEFAKLEKQSQMDDELAKLKAELNM